MKRYFIQSMLVVVSMGAGAMLARLGPVQQLFAEASVILELLGTTAPAAAPSEEILGVLSGSHSASQLAGEDFLTRLAHKNGSARLSSMQPGQFNIPAENLAAMIKLGKEMGVDPDSIIYVPAVTDSPTAFNAIQDKQRDLSAEEAYNSEHREPEWATAMEGIMRERFSQDEVEKAGFGGLELAEVECRTSACRLEIEYPDSLEAALDERQGISQSSPKGPPRVVDYFVSSAGPLSNCFTTVSEGSVQTESGMKHRVTKLVLFSDEEIDPRDYSEWHVRTRISPEDREKAEALAGKETSRDGDKSAEK
ncbi:MAG: hypothetical protein SFV15_10445 [Polyangiaceae bacterium]|nr:hypothetical protein [Polyangiaceae bacterium]